MGAGLARIARIAPGEGRLAVALVAVMFLTATGAGAGTTAADALLFARFGTGSLPQLYLVLGVVSFGCAIGVSAVFGAFRRERVYPVSIGALAALLLALRGAIAAADASALVYPLAWLGANVAATLQGIVAWGVASWLCDAREAKRLFPVANAAKIAGFVAGSASVAPLVLVLRLEDLFVLWAATLVATTLVILRIARTAPAAAFAARAVSLRHELLAGFRVVRGSALLRYLALALVLFSILFFFMALPFTRGARAALPRAEDLASFLGLFNATTTTAAFLASLLVANRFYARFGVVSGVLVLTLIYLIGFAALTVSDAFAVLAAARWIQLAWLAGMADAAYQALFNPVPPERRDQMRAFMEGVPGQAGIALAGTLLIVGDRTLEPRAVAAAGVLFAAITAVLIWRVRDAYRGALVAALRAGRPEPFIGAERAYATLLADRGALTAATTALGGSDVTSRRAAAQILSEIGTTESTPALLAAARDPDALVRAFALRGGARLEPAVFRDAARATAADPDLDARCAALLVLQRAGEESAGARVRAACTDADPAMRLAAVRAVAASSLADAVELLAAMARDADGPVRRAAAGALSVRDPTRALALAAAGLADPSRQDDALQLLETLGVAQAFAPLRVYAIAQRDRALRYLGLAASVAGDGELAALLRRALEERARIAARRAVRGAAILSGRVASVAMLDGLVASDRSVRAVSLESLETCVRPELARPLLAVWESAHEPRPLGGLRDEDDPWLRACGVALTDGGGDMASLITIPLMERVLFLRGVPLFASLDPADLQQIARIATERAFTDGETAFRQGDRGDALYLVADGTLVIDVEGHQVARRGPGEVVGEMAIVSDAPRIASVVAAGPTRTLRIGRADFEAILRDRPETALGVIRVLSRRLVEASTARGG